MLGLIPCLGATGDFHIKSKTDVLKQCNLMLMQVSVLPSNFSANCMMKSVALGGLLDNTIDIGERSAAHRNLRCPSCLPSTRSHK